MNEIFVLRKLISAILSSMGYTTPNSHLRKQNTVYFANWQVSKQALSDEKT